MGIKTKVEIMGKLVEGEEIEFEPIKEDWNIYKLKDDTTIKIKTVVSKVIRTNERHPTRNDPIYSVSSQNVVEAEVPEKLKLEK